MKIRSLIKNEAGLAGAVGAVVSVLVCITVGILVYFKITSSLGGGGSAEQVTALANINTTATTIFQLAPIVCIVLIASIVLSVVMNFGRGPGA